jgi:pyruvate/2-oxoglutarate dehydrogenase complex dihydrolipoamide acyltransferase (E2) component
VIAECWFRGRRYEVKCVELPEGDARILVDGMANTKQAAIVQAKGKAEARALAKLHALLTGRSEDDEIPAEVIETTATAAVAVQPAPQPKPQPALPPQTETAPVSWGEEASQIAAKVSQKSSEIMDAFYISLGDCTTIEELQKEWQSLQAVAKTDKPDQRVMQFLARFKDHRKSQLGG